MAVMYHSEFDRKICNTSNNICKDLKNWHYCQYW